MNTHAKYATLIFRMLALPVALLPALAAGPARGADNNWVGGDPAGPLNYDQLVQVGGFVSASDNWDTGFLPWSGFDEVAVINNQDPNPVFLADDLTSDGPADSLLNDPAGLNVTGGAFEIRNGGVLSAVAGANAPATFPGDVTVGSQGELRIHNGGSLSAANDLSSSGSLALGESSSAATLTVANTANLSGGTRVSGPNVSFSAGEIVLGGSHTLTAEITDQNTHSALSTAGTATLRGSVALELAGVVPAAGNSWNLIDAATIDGVFANKGIPVGPGLGAFIDVVPGGTNGQLVRATIANQLQLSVNLLTGGVEMKNLSSTTSEDINAYSILSNADILDPNRWSSFTGAGQTGWREANAGGRHFSELNLTGSRVIAADQSIDLGDPVTYEFGAAPDVSFEYALDSGESRSGQVEFIGKNTLVLQVDTASGETAIKNDSAFGVRLNSYSMISLDGNLDQNGWTPLANNDAQWRAANPAANHLSELNLTGSLGVSSGSVIAIGNAYNETGNATEDLVFQFTLADSAEVPGDYDATGDVGLPDLNLVLFNWNSNTVPPGWVNQIPTGLVGLSELNGVLFNWGNTGGGSGGPSGSFTGVVEYVTLSGSGSQVSVPVPEPSSCLLAALSTLGLVCLRRQKLT